MHHSNRLQLVVLVALVVLFSNSCFALSNPHSMSAYDASPPITVPKQTALQAQIYANLTANAQQLSEAAIPALLDYFDSEEFRANISNLALFQNQSAQFILDTLNSYITLNVITHGLPAGLQYGYLDVTLEQLITLTFLPNQFERISLNLLNASLPFVNNSVQIEDNAEMEIFGFPPFTVPIYEVPLNESENRVSYAAQDLFRPAASSQYYGAVQLVLSKDYIQNMTALSPFDTGSYSMCCELRIVSPQCDIFNCTGTQIQFGTLEYFNHLYLQSAHYMSYDLSSLFQRLFGPPEPQDFTIQIQYFEADIMGNILLPEAVQYVIGDFINLFGREPGQMLRNWCIDNNFPLVWAFGLVATTVPPIGGQNESFVDPLVLQALPNVTFPSSMLPAFETAFILINQTLDENPGLFNNTLFWNSQWETVYDIIVPPSLHFHYLKPNVCADTCIGLDDDNNCFCISAPSDFSDF